MNQIGRWIAFAILTGACGVPGNGPWMRPGQDCMLCHAQGGRAQRNTWTVGGTVYDAQGNAAVGALVVIRDASGHAVTMESNGAGNFYTAEALATPFQAVSVMANGKQVDMPMPANVPVSGACNACHTAGGMAGLPITTPNP